jgi:pyridoxine 5-phosphate synthase
MKLGVNIDHIAVLRNARLVNDPDPLDALGIVKRAGADQITIHLREDRRHIHDEDAQKIIASSALPINLECSLDEDIIDIVCKLKPHRATLVPEKREEVTTEGGLDVLGQTERLKRAIEKLHAADIEVSLFIDPDIKTIEASAKLGVAWIEIHTGSYANLFAMLNSNLSQTQHSIKSLEKLSRSELKSGIQSSLEQISLACKKAQKLQLKVAAGHGLNYQNVHDILHIEEIEELNIGQSIIARSIFTGLESAIIEMKELLV